MNSRDGLVARLHLHDKRRAIDDNHQAYDSNDCKLALHGQVGLPLRSWGGHAYTAAAAGKSVVWWVNRSQPDSDAQVLSIELRVHETKECAGVQLCERE